MQSNSVADPFVMMIPRAGRNYIPILPWVSGGLEDCRLCGSAPTTWKAMQVGTVAAGRLGLRALLLLSPSST